MIETESNKRSVEVTVEGGPAWPVKFTYDFNAIADAEAVCGLNLLMAVGMPAKMTAAQLRGLAYAFLSVNDQKVTLKDAGDLMTADVNAVYRTVAICCGFEAATPESDLAVSEDSEQTPNA